MDSGIIFFTLVSCLSACVSQYLFLSLLATNALALNPSVSLCLFFSIPWSLCLSLFPPVSFLGSVPSLHVTQSISWSVSLLPLTSLPLCRSVRLSRSLSLPVSLPIRLSPLFHDLCLSPSLPFSLTPLPRPLSPKASPLLPSKSLWPPWKGYCKRE